MNRNGGGRARDRESGLVAVTFDFWGTLYENAYVRDERLHILERVLERNGQPRAWESLEAAYGHARSVWDRVWRQEQRSIPIARWLDELLGHLEASLSDDAAAALGREIEEAYLHSNVPRPVDGVCDVLPALAQRYAVGLISDTGLTPGRVLRQVMARDRLLSLFDALTFSDELGIAKPSPEPFLHTLEHLGARPEQGAHIGDLPETDIRGARSVGMRAVLFLGVSHREDGRDLADAAFEHYDELEHLLARLE